MDIEFGHMTKRELCAALTEVAAMANVDVIDEEDKPFTNEFVKGRSSAMETVLRIIAKHDAEARA